MSMQMRLEASAQYSAQIARSTRSSVRAFLWKNPEKCLIPQHSVALRSWDRRTMLQILMKIEYGMHKNAYELSKNATVSP